MYLTRHIQTFGVFSIATNWSNVCVLFDSISVVHCVSHTVRTHSLTQSFTKNRPIELKCWQVISYFMREISCHPLVLVLVRHCRRCRYLVVSLVCICGTFIYFIDSVLYMCVCECLCFVVFDIAQNKSCNSVTTCALFVLLLILLFFHVTIHSMLFAKWLCVSVSHTSVLFFEFQFSRFRLRFSKLVKRMTERTNKRTMK